MKYLLLILNITLLLLGQMLWKIGLRTLEFKISMKAIFKTLFNSYIFAGCLVYALATFVWLYLLSKEELSTIYPLQSLCYLAAAFAGVIFFKESLSISKAAGILLISAGAIFIAIK